MKQLLLILIIVLAVLHLNAQSVEVHQVNSAQFDKLIKDQGGVLLDVRTQSEFRNGHIANSGQLNYYTFNFKKKLLLLPKDQPIFLYCNTGYRSKKAAKYLADNNFEKVYNLEHGIMEWELKNLPVVVDPNAEPDTDNKMEYAQYTQLIDSSDPVFIDFYASWCSPCRKMMPFIDSLKVDYHNKIDIVKVNVDASKKLVKELKISGVPYLALYDKGELVFSKNGIISREDLTSIFDNCIRNLP
jgi:thioredoxin 1